MTGTPVKRARGAAPGQGPSLVAYIDGGARGNPGPAGYGVFITTAGADPAEPPLAELYGFLGVAFAFGLTVLTMAYAIGHISGCHLNPAVSIGLAVAKRFSASELLAYIVAQVIRNSRA